MTGGRAGRRLRVPPAASVAGAVPAVWTVALSLLLLGPALGPGHVLAYDMVWVPDLALRPDFLGVGSALPRAVPSDAVVAVLDEVVPGAVLQDLVLLGALVAGGLGAVRLAGDAGLVGRCLAAALFVWNPFTVERLLLGHWPTLVGYAVLPWLALAARQARRTGRVPAGLLVLLPLGSLSASAGLATAVVLLTFGLGRSRTWGLLVGLAVAANLPWAVSGLLHAGAATTDPAGATAFALRAEGPLPAPLTALGLGGVWNAETVPATREGPLGLLALLVLVALAALGARGWANRWGRRDVAAFAACWVVGWGLAVLTWLAPDAVAWLGAEVPGGGLLRDGSRLLGLSALALVPLVAAGGDRLSGWFDVAWQRVLVGSVLALLPVALMPDAAWGVSGRLAATDYPPSYAAAREAVGDAEGADVLVLPFSSYRAPAWNEGRKVLDPLGRYLRPDFVASDELVVSGVTIAGEDPRGAQVREALGAPTPQQRAEALADLGVGVVVRDDSAPGPAPDVAGTEVVRTGDLVVTRLADPAPAEAPPTWVAAMAAAWLGWLGSLLAGVMLLALRRRRPPARGAHVSR
ncbi:hypothetical protein ACFP3Q_00425 [Nocardioides sp. GCM10027113]|uniref:hypothetical protein n=1 Tax=unclassified Nocardioides TaxID=2615069 RepID=UPI00361B1AA5